MVDFLDNYITKIKINNFSGKISDYFNSRIEDVKLLFNKIIIEFEILKIKYELIINYINLGKFIYKNYSQENVSDFSYKDEFYNMNHEIGKCKRFIKKLKKIKSVR